MHVRRPNSAIGVITEYHIRSILITQRFSDRFIIKLT